MPPTLAYLAPRDLPTSSIQNVNTLPVVPSGFFLVFIASCSKGVELSSESASHVGATIRQNTPRYDPLSNVIKIEGVNR